ncbi:hypothetical protein PIB30_092789 [Stylosanthes scabra]|uniref:Uncharacterized protein n=1 Tax=Stylosanthes scabra TaxID=79078 RepID=A0ABU6XWR4_9FABA|nr:hypothetical protein [Stylosanthes scabra]
MRHHHFPISPIVTPKRGTPHLSMTKLLHPLTHMRDHFTHMRHFHTITAHHRRLCVTHMTVHIHPKIMADSSSSNEYDAHLFSSLFNKTVFERFARNKDIISEKSFELEDEEYP